MLSTELELAQLSIPSLEILLEAANFLDTLDNKEPHKESALAHEVELKPEVKKDSSQESSLFKDLSIKDFYKPRSPRSMRVSQPSHCMMERMRRKKLKMGFSGLMHILPTNRPNKRCTTLSVIVNANEYIIDMSVDLIEKTKIMTMLKRTLFEKCVNIMKELSELSYGESICSNSETSPVSIESDSSVYQSSGASEQIGNIPSECCLKC